MAAARLRDEFIFEASTFLIELHNWVLAMFRQNRALVPCALKDEEIHVVFQLIINNRFEKQEAKCVEGIDCCVTNAHQFN